MAHAVQHPGSAPGTVPVLRSDAEGSGKSTVLEWLARIFGPHALLLSSPDELTGQFNSHLEHVSLIGLNEPAFPGDHKAAGKLKSMITEPYWLLNGKFRAARRVPNLAHIALTSNSAWVVPAGSHARRFLLLDVDESRAGDRKYFDALWAEANNGGIEAMLHALLRIDLSRVNLLDPPKTAALRQQQIRSASTMVRWALDAAACGVLVPGSAHIPGGTPGGFGMRWPSAQLYGAYQAWCQGMKERPASNIEVGRWLGRCGFKAPPQAGIAHYAIPDAGTFIAAVRKQAGI